LRIVKGLFHAYPVDIGLGESRQNKLLQVNILYRLFEEFSGGEWTDCSAENLEITGYHILEKRDHSLNDNTIEALKSAMGWDGRDPFWLQDNAVALAEKPVQVKLGMEDFNGKLSLKVLFLNPYGSQRGTVSKADDEMRRTLANRLGPKFAPWLAAHPANPPMPAGKPAAPAPKPAAVPKQAPPPAQPPAPAAPRRPRWSRRGRNSANTARRPSGTRRPSRRSGSASSPRCSPASSPTNSPAPTGPSWLAQGSAKIIPF